MTTNEAALKLAREVYRQYGERKAREAGSDVDKVWGLEVLAGEADATHGVQIALAAILEVTERAAGLADEQVYSRPDDDYQLAWSEAWTASATALRNMEHLA